MGNTILLQNFMQGGVPNFAMVAAIVEFLRKEEKATLKWPGMRAAEFIVLMTLIMSYHSGRGVVGYCTVSRRVLGEKIARMVGGELKPYCEKTIERVTNLLVELGLIIKHQPARANKAAPYSVNHYTLGARLKEIMATAIRKLYFGGNLLKNRGATFLSAVLEEKSKNKRRGPSGAGFYAQRKDEEPTHGAAYQPWAIPKEWNKEKWSGPSLSAMVEAALKR